MTRWRGAHSLSLRLMAICMVCIAAAFEAEAADMEEEEISGNGFKAIQAAIPEFTRSNLNLSNYVIRVLRLNDKIVVSFIDLTSSKADTKNTRGSASVRVPTFEVSLSRGNFQVIDSGYSR